ncbi:MAG: ABC transporter ATP-binding protein [Clostridia bacterium]
MILEVRNVDYAYKSQKDKQILNHVSLQFDEGKFYTIVGPSGSGKTTLLSLLAGLDSPVKGSVLYNGSDIRKSGLNHHRKHNVSLVFQNYNLIDYLTTEENVRLGGKKNSRKLLEEVCIAKEDWKRNVLQLSGGQQQRVAIARALASEARVLLADEPTGNLDENTADEIIELLKKTAHELGKCVIAVTHSKQLANEADEIIQIKDGMIQFKTKYED